MSPLSRNFYSEIFFLKTSLWKAIEYNSIVCTKENKFIRRSDIFNSTLVVLICFNILFFSFWIPKYLVCREHDGKEIDQEFVLHNENKKIHHGLKECTYTLTIPSSKHFDTGIYSFKAFNRSGEVECSVSAVFENLLK